MLTSLAHKTLQIAIGEDVDQEPKPDEGKRSCCLGRKGGLKGGKARWKGVSVKKRKELARKAAKARWAKRRPKPS